MTALGIGSWVRFAPNPRWPKRTVDAQITGTRKSPNANTRVRTTGWLDTLGTDGQERSVRPSRCTPIDPPQGGRTP
jgi:hypothetical protein